MRGPKSRKAGGSFFGRPSLSYIYFLLTLTVASVLIARDWFHPRLELLHQREFVQEEMGFFYHKSTGDRGFVAESTAKDAPDSNADDGLRAGVMEKSGVTFLDLGRAAFVRGRDFEADGYSLKCPVGQGPLFPRPLTVVVAFPNAGYEWLNSVFKHVAGGLDEGSQEDNALSSKNVIVLRSGSLSELRRMTSGRDFRAVVVLRDPRDWISLTAQSRPKAKQTWSNGILGKFFGRKQATDPAEEEVIDKEIDNLKQDIAGDIERSQKAPGLLSATFDLVRFASEGNASGRVAFVRYEDMWQRNPKGGWPALACWLGLHKQSVGQLLEDQQRLEQEGFFTPGLGPEGHAPGLWRNHFSPGNVRHFKEQLKGVVSWLGYQRDESWG